jgi:hypothetical protein
MIPLRHRAEAGSAVGFKPAGGGPQGPPPIVPSFGDRVSRSAPAGWFAPRGYMVVIAASSRHGAGTADHRSRDPNGSLVMPCSRGQGRASRTTPTPLGLSSACSQPAICTVSRSWLCRSRARTTPWRGRACQLDDPLRGQIADVRDAAEREHVVHAQRVKRDRPRHNQPRRTRRRWETSSRGVSSSA